MTYTRLDAPSQDACAVTHAAPPRSSEGPLPGGPLPSGPSPDGPLPRGPSPEGPSLAGTSPGGPSAMHEAARSPPRFSAGSSERATSGAAQPVPREPSAPPGCLSAAAERATAAGGAAHVTTSVPGELPAAAGCPGAAMERANAGGAAQDPAPAAAAAAGGRRQAVAAHGDAAACGEAGSADAGRKRRADAVEGGAAPNREAGSAGASFAAVGGPPATAKRARLGPGAPPAGERASQPAQALGGPAAEALPLAADGTRVGGKAAILAQLPLVAAGAAVSPFSAPAGRSQCGGGAASLSGSPESGARSGAAPPADAAVAISLDAAQAPAACCAKRGQGGGPRAIPDPPSCAGTGVRALAEAAAVALDTVPDSAEGDTIQAAPGGPVRLGNTAGCHGAGSAGPGPAALDPGEGASVNPCVAPAETRCCAGGQATGGMGAAALRAAAVLASAVGLKLQHQPARGNCRPLPTDTEVQELELAASQLRPAAPQAQWKHIDPITNPPATAALYVPAAPQLPLREPASGAAARLHGCTAGDVLAAAGGMRGTRADAPAEAVLAALLQLSGDAAWAGMEVSPGRQCPMRMAGQGQVLGAGLAGDGSWAAKLLMHKGP